MGGFRSRMSDQGLFLREVQSEYLMEVRLDVAFNFLCFLLWTDETDQPVIRVAYIFEASEVWVRRVVGGHLLCFPLHLSCLSVVPFFL